jgi:hypothetical protein
VRKECHRVGFGAERRQCLSEKEKLGAELSERILDAGGA